MSGDVECITTLYDMSSITRLDRFNVEITISDALSPSLTFGNERTLLVIK